MRILTLLAGENSLAPAVALTNEIRTFNREIDFRLRFLHIEIEEVHVAPARLHEAARSAIDRIDLKTVEDGDVLQAAARLTLHFQAVRPDLFVIVSGDSRDDVPPPPPSVSSKSGQRAAGPDELFAAGVAAATICEVRVGLFGFSAPGASAPGKTGILKAGGLDLGEKPSAAIAAMTGVAREIS